MWNNGKLSRWTLDKVTANQTAPEIKAMIKRTTKRIVEGASHSSKEERVEGILNFQEQ